MSLHTCEKRRQRCILSGHRGKQQRKTLQFLLSISKLLNVESISRKQNATKYLMFFKNKLKPEYTNI